MKTKVGVNETDGMFPKKHNIDMSKRRAIASPKKRLKITKARSGIRVQKNFCGEVV